MMCCSSTSPPRSSACCQLISLSSSAALDQVLRECYWLVSWCCPGAVHVCKVLQVVKCKCIQLLSSSLGVAVQLLSSSLGARAGLLWSVHVLPSFVHSVLGFWRCKHAFSYASIMLTNCYRPKNILDFTSTYTTTCVFFGCCPGFAWIMCCPVMNKRHVSLYTQNHVGCLNASSPWRKIFCRQKLSSHLLSYKLILAKIIICHWTLIPFLCDST
jgi:hypothetical protein